MKNFLLIIFLILVTVLAGCRASREVHTTQQQHQSSNIDVEAHRLDSIWSLLVERYHVHIEFYEPNEVPPQINDTSTKATLQGAAPGLVHPSVFPKPSGIGGLGAVKSIDIEAERTQSEQSLSQADTTAVSKTESESAQQTDRNTEARQDNGTWIIVSVVAAAAILIFLIYLTRRYLKK